MSFYTAATHQYTDRYASKSRGLAWIIILSVLGLHGMAIAHLFKQPTNISTLQAGEQGQSIQTFMIQAPPPQVAPEPASVAAAQPEPILTTQAQSSAFTATPIEPIPQPIKPKPTKPVKPQPSKPVKPQPSKPVKPQPQKIIQPTTQSHSSTSTTHSQTSSTNTGQSHSSSSQQILGQHDIQYRKKPVPKYPVVSRKLKEQGQSIVLVQVDNNGQPIQVRLNSSSGFARLDKAALDAVQKAQFKPYQQGGTAQTVWVKIPIIFSLTH